MFFLLLPIIVKVPRDGTPVGPAQRLWDGEPRQKLDQHLSERSRQHGRRMGQAGHRLLRGQTYWLGAVFIKQDNLRQGGGPGGVEAEAVLEEEGNNKDRSDSSNFSCTHCQGDEGLQKQEYKCSNLAWPPNRKKCIFLIQTVAKS